jgi:hypothetical protein
MNYAPTVPFMPDPFDSLPPLIRIRDYIAFLLENSDGVQKLGHVGRLSRSQWSTVNGQRSTETIRKGIEG